MVLCCEMHMHACDCVCLCSRVGLRRRGGAGCVCAVLSALAASTLLQLGAFAYVTTKVCVPARRTSQPNQALSRSGLTGELKCASVRSKAATTLSR